MRVLQINKFFHSRGGADQVFFRTCALLEDQGHEVGHFATAHPNNVESKYAQFFVKGGFTEADLGTLSLRRKADAFFEGVYNRQAYRDLQAMVREFRPDIAHAHNINYQLSPSIFDALAEEGVPAVMTLHDYSMVCTAGTLFVHDQVCERCHGGRHYNAVLHRCFHESIPASAMGMLNKYVHAARRTWEKVSQLISPSRFLRQKMIEFGVPPERITYLPVFLETLPNAPRKEPGDYVLYFGRLSANKGVRTLPDAAQRISKPILIVGDGPLRDELAGHAARSNGKLQLLPFVRSRQEMGALIEGCAVAVVPSIWYENQPLAILETYALGKPVVASRLGGIPELVDEGSTGLLFRPGDAADLADKLEFLLTNPELSRAWGEAGRQKVERQFSRETHYQGLMQVYRMLCA